MRYYIIEGDIDMIIRKWPDNWRIPSINKEVPERTTEEEAKQGEMKPPEIQVLKIPRTGQGKIKKKDNGPKKIETQKGKKENT
jgi:hypothetical protein